MSREDFIKQLKSLGYAVEERENNRIAVPYTIPLRKFVGQEIRLGFEVPGDFPMNPPSGPHLTPRLLPLNDQSKEHPAGGVHASDFGADWQYWSRPFPNWNNTDRTVKTYLAHIRKLFQTQ